MLLTALSFSIQPAGALPTGLQTLVIRDPTAASLEFSYLHKGTEARAYRAALDDGALGGNGDGVVADSEVSAFEVGLRGIFSMAAAGDPAGLGVTIDGKAPNRIALHSLEMLGAEGPADSETDLELRIVLALGFPTQPSERHVAGIRGTFMGASTAMETNATFVLRVPQDFRLGATPPLPVGLDVEASNDTLMIWGNETGRLRLDVEFTRASNADAALRDAAQAPAPSLFWVLAVLLLSVWRQRAGL